MLYDVLFSVASTHIFLRIYTSSRLYTLALGFLVYFLSPVNCDVFCVYVM